MPPTPLPTPSPALHTPMSALTPPRAVPAGQQRDMARSLPRDYGASLRALAGRSLSPPRRPTRATRGFTRDHMGGSWDQLDAPRAPMPPLRASWDHLGPTWDHVDMSRDSPHGPDALLTHTLRPARHHDLGPNSRGHMPEGEDAGGHGVADLASPRDSVAGAKGLLNAPGQNNCFLNSAVQVSTRILVHRWCVAA